MKFSNLKKIERDFLSKCLKDFRRNKKVTEHGISNIIGSHVFFDVDDTLILHLKNPHYGDLMILDPIDNNTRYIVKKHNVHIELLKELKKKGNTIIVWSAAGKQWVDAVIAHLQIEEFVDYKLSKPNVIIDDLESIDWMPKRVYLENK